MGFPTAMAGAVTEAYVPMCAFTGTVLFCRCTMMKISSLTWNLN